MSYLQNINGKYYFVLRIKNKISKTSLGTSYLKDANIIKFKILKKLGKTMGIKSLLSLNMVAEEGDDKKESERIAKVLEKTLLREKQKSNKIKKISTQLDYEENYTSVSEEFVNFMEFVKKTKNVKSNTFLEYETSFKYLFLFFPKDTKTFELMKTVTWDEYRDFLQKLPNNIMRRFKEGMNLISLAEDIVEEYDDNDKEVKLLNAKTINKHFMTYNQFFNFLVRRQVIKSNPLNEYGKLATTENPYKSYTEEELMALFQIDDKQIKDFFKFLLYTGMRLSSVIKIKKENIDLENKLLKIPDDKTINGIRTISIHDRVLGILKNFKNSSREHLFFDTDNKDKVQKFINPIIRTTTGVNKTIHSFRKNFTIELFKVSKDINLKKYILGHSQLKDLTFTTYNEEKVDFEEMNKIINSIHYRFDNIEDLMGFDLI
jgi:integrase